MTETDSYRESLIGQATMAGHVLFNNKDYTHATMAYGRAIELGTTNPRTFSNIALSFARQNQVEQMIRSLQMALKLPHSPQDLLEAIEIIAQFGVSIEVLTALAFHNSQVAPNEPPALLMIQSADTFCRRREFAPMMIALQGALTFSRSADIIRETVRILAAAHTGIELGQSLGTRFTLPPDFPPTVTMSTLGLNGQFGNQLFQYAFPKFYANTHNFRMQTPNWIGRRLYTIDDEDISVALPLCIQTEDELYRLFPPFSCPLGESKPIYNVDIYGGFLYRATQFKPFKESFRNLFALKHELKEPLAQFLTQKKGQATTLIAIHVRLGDSHSPSSIPALVQWLRANLNSYPKPVVYIATDTPESVKPAFDEFKPVYADDYKSPLDDAPFLPDFYMLSHADVLLPARSSFSFAAALLNPHGKVFRENSAGVVQAIDPWESTYD